MTTHLQGRPNDWAAASDEQIIQALFEPVRFVDPCWMAYLKRRRPAALAAYLRMFAAGGGRLGAPAQQFLGRLP